MTTQDNPAAIVDGFVARARKVRTACGTGEMVWRVWGAGSPLLLLHGGSGSWTHWLRNIPVLEQHFELWVPDLPGLGASAMPPEPWTPASIADVMLKGIDELFDRDAELRLVGFSFGGHIAGLVAKGLVGKDPVGTVPKQRLRDLTLVGVAGLGLRADPREAFAKERAGMRAEELAAVHRKNLEILMIADPAKVDDLAVHLQTWNAQHARFRSRPFAPTDELARALEHVPVPLKTIWGTQDVIARPSVQSRLDILRQHHPELVVRLIEGAGHWVMYENANAFNAALLEVLQS